MKWNATVCAHFLHNIDAIFSTGYRKILAECLRLSHGLPQSWHRPGIACWHLLPVSGSVLDKCFKINSISVNCLEQLLGPMLLSQCCALCSSFDSSFAYSLRVCVPSVFVWLSLSLSLWVCVAVCLCVFAISSLLPFCCGKTNTQHKLLAKH